MTTPSLSVDAWPSRLDAAVARTVHFRRAMVVRETRSALDAARRLNVGPGDVVAAWRQTAGRGRLGRDWADTHAEGVALILTIESDYTERPAVVSAVAVATALDAFLEVPAGIKWPNDIHVDGRKLAGILIEQDAERALVGIGVNVGQRRWPPELASRAVSLKQRGIDVDRLVVMEAIIEAFDAAVDLPESVLVEAFNARNTLRGRVVTLADATRAVRGRIEGWDPSRGLIVDTGDGVEIMSAATTTVVEDPTPPST